jgi:hypothetical protein
LNFETGIDTNGAQTEYNVEYAPSEAGPYTPVPGSSGSITTVEDFAMVPIHLEGLSPETPYYFRAVGTNEKGAATERVEVTTASAHPKAFDPKASNVTGTSAHVTGSVNPETLETQWRFEYATSKTGPWTVVPGGSGTIATAQAGEANQAVEGDLSGLSTSGTYYVRLFAENATGTSTSEPAAFETAGPPLVDTFAVHAIHGEDVRMLGTVTPDGYDTHYDFQYVTREQFEKQGGEGGFADAQSTPVLDAGPGERALLRSGEFGYPTVYVGVDIPGLLPGKAYEFRIVASSTAPGNPVIQGEAQTLTVPVAPEVSAEAQGAGCPNLQFRTGPSEQLPDCRAYEQITPVEKEGAFEAFNAIGSVSRTGAFVGSDGDHFMLEASRTNWGSGQGPYVFSRASAGWQMTSTASQPEASNDEYEPGAFSPDLASLSLAAGWQTGNGIESPDKEFKVGPPGGPYTTVVSAPRTSKTSWADASEDLGKLILQSEDRNLVPGHTSVTTSGPDLYEYSEGRLRQANVLTDGAAIGACGATVPTGPAEGPRKGGAGLLTNLPAGARRGVSADGSRVFFEAVPGGSCADPMHLYVRVGGTETLDVGAYKFLAANKDGSKVLLERQNGEIHEVVLYDIESHEPKLLLSVHHETEFRISEDFTTIYFTSNTESLTREAPPDGGLYRYDIPNKELRFALPIVTFGDKLSEVSANGRYFYVATPEVLGVPGGKSSAQSDQLYRYDSAENSVECVSCASPFDPEPKFRVNNEGDAVGGSPSVPVVSDNGDYAFFETVAALVPGDLDGEAEGSRFAHNTSWDIYEWRRVGVNGCAHVEGCVSLITPGTDGGLVALIGTTASGSDVFFTTQSSLSAQDRDTSGDVYDARVGGGFAVAARPVECEGDACSTPVGAPNDVTPSSFAFTGAGNLIPGSSVVVKPKAKKKASARCSRGKKGRGKCVKRKTKAKAGKANVKSQRGGK